MCYTGSMGAVIQLFFIGVTLGILHFFFGIILAFIRTRNASVVSYKRWFVCLAVSAIASFLIFAYGVGTQLCLGRDDFQNCVGAVLEVSLKMGILIFPMIVILGMVGVILGHTLANKLQPKASNKKTRKK